MGRRDWELSAEQKMDARAALRLLEGTGLSLEHLARQALASQARPERRVPVDEAVSAFLRRGREKGLRSGTLDWYGRELGDAFAGAFAGRTLETIERRELRAYLDGRTAGVRPAVFRCVRALLRFALQQEPPWIGADPTRGMKVEGARRDHEVPVLTVAQCAQLLDTAGRFRAALAVALFAGLRPEEIWGRFKEPLRWEAIDEAGRTIALPAALAKTRVPWRMEGLPEALWAWLAAVPAAERGATVAPCRFQSIVRWARGELGMSTWPRDVTRHTFATYAVHNYKDPGRVALWLRHEGDQRLLHRHYLSVNVSEAAAQAFFALRPNTHDSQADAIAAAVDALPANTEGSRGRAKP